MTKITPTFADDLKQYGEDTALECFNCGTCVAICPLIDGSFPRKLIRYIQIGAKERILENRNELWKCLHCGLCSESCPRGADPGGVLLSLKRYAVASWRNS